MRGSRTASRCLARWRRAGKRTGAAERAAIPVGEEGLRRMDPVDFVGEGGSGRFDMDSGVWGLRVNHLDSKANFA